MIVLRKFTASTSFVNPCIVSWFCRNSSQSCPSLNRNEITSDQSRTAHNGDVSYRNNLGVQGLPQFWQDKKQLDIRQIEVVDSDTWSAFSGLASVSNGAQDTSLSRLFGLEEVGDEVAHNRKQIESDSDVDDVEDMRIRGKLFYKVEQNSMEFEEYKFDFHGSKFKSKHNDKREREKKEHTRVDTTQNVQKSLKSKDGHHQVVNNKENLKHGPLINKERLDKIIKDKYDVCAPDDRSCAGKKQRNPTFNQLTGPYHEPFCLDIYVSKGSVRACVIHRATSKVVIVAHSISKDMKFDLGSTKSVAAAHAVGKILAKRSLEDDIHDVIYTPRKGDKLEGKLQVVLQSIMDNGLNVKVKLKQRNPMKAIRRL